MRQHDTREDGFSAVELVIAMFLVAILALALLPLLMTGTRTSDTNRSLVAATAFASAQLAPIRADFAPHELATTCTSVQSAAVTARPGPSGSGLLADVLVSGCPGEYPGTVTVTAIAYASASPGSPLATVATRIVVSAP
ncbi:prepilin-type N-terminal cleavage/methylation domain-containing protein [Microbacterium sp. NPDC078428]|uniref:prepilin-type N-terminal cleavage/methylation domain-containing protein n=1 Tax=Microbacterium sp. NPDC078428 TaxID=3364190 RepID=UPI0037C657A4